MDYINKPNVYIIDSIFIIYYYVTYSELFKYHFKLNLSSWKACIQHLILAHSANQTDFLIKNLSGKLCLSTLSASNDRKPKWERKRRAVWNSCEGGGGLQSVCGSGKRLDFQISSLCRSKAFSYSICFVIRIRSLSCWTSSWKEEDEAFFKENQEAVADEWSMSPRRARRTVQILKYLSKSMCQKSPVFSCALKTRVSNTY